MDFTGDSLASGRVYRTFKVIDDYARNALAIEIGVSLTAQHVVRALERLCEWDGTSESIRGDSGPGLRAEVLQGWAKDKGTRCGLIQPGCPAQNGYVERFNGTYRLEVGREQFRSPEEAHAVTEEWLAIYNALRAPSVTCRRWCSSNDGSDGSFMNERARVRGGSHFQSVGLQSKTIVR